MVKQLVGGLLWAASSTMGIIAGRLMVAHVALAAHAWASHIEQFANWSK